MYQKIQRLTPQGDPADEITTVAADWQADLIVIGSHGENRPYAPDGRQCGRTCHTPCPGARDDSAYVLVATGFRG